MVMPAESRERRSSVEPGKPVCSPSVNRKRSACTLSRRSQLVEPSTLQATAEAKATQNPGMHLGKLTWLHVRKWGLRSKTTPTTTKNPNQSPDLNELPAHPRFSSNYRQDKPLNTIQRTPPPVTILQRTPTGYAPFHGDTIYSESDSTGWGFRP